MGGLPTQKTIYAFVHSPKDSKTMYVALREGLYLSKDGGNQWSLLKKSPKGVVAIVLQPKDPSKIFAGSGDGKIFLSNDGGSNWKLQNREKQ